MIAHPIEFPARAGMNRIVFGDELGRERVPRTRGDEPVSEGCRNCYAESSPHARG